MDDSSGFICVALTGDRLQELDIPMMVAENQDPHKTAYTVTVDYKHGEFLAPTIAFPALHHFRGPDVAFSSFNR